MTPEQFARVEYLFEGACAQPHAARGDWLREQCNDPEVLRKVEGMLTHDAVTVAPIDAPAMGAGFHVGRVDEIEQRLRDEFVAAGRYRIKALLGEGGFGSVYRAEQVEPVRRHVALKVIKLGMDTRRILARFEAERQTLAMMNHPGIAKFLDAGITASGRSYFVMELVDGKPITTYCDENQLDTRARLSLYTQVCDAIRHAHQKGVLHRDIKPSNVLIAEVDGKPIPVVIDFGIARALDDESGAVSLMTQQGQMIGTPEYMSPEQADGNRDIDTRTDIYSLGVLLYELLTGTTPLDRSTLGRRSLPELQRWIREVEPPTPSTRVRKFGQRGTIAARGRGTDSSTLSRLLQGDLDWIVMKAIDKQRDLRYESVDAFAADIGRYLHDEPVLARPQSAVYRFRKFSRRHQGAMGAAASMVVLLVAGVVGTTYGMMKARREAQAARDEAAVAKAVSDFLNNDLLAAIEIQARGHDVRMKDILDAMSERIDGRFDDQPRVELAIHCSLGRAYKYLGDYARATYHLERGVEIVRQSSDVVAANRVDALFVLADVRMLTGRHAEAEPLLKEALVEGVRLEGENGWYPLLIMNSMAQTYRGLDRLADAESLYRRVIEIRRTLGDDLDNQREILTTMSNLAVVYRLDGRHELMEGLLSEVVPRAREMFGPEHSLTMKTEYDLAFLYRVRDRLAEADALLTPLLATMQRTMGRDHPNVFFVMNELASLRKAQGRTDEALKLMQTVVDNQIRAFGESHEATQDSIAKLAALYEEVNRPNDAANWRIKLQSDESPHAAGP